MFWGSSVIAGWWCSSFSSMSSLFLSRIDPGGDDGGVREAFLSHLSSQTEIQGSKVAGVEHRSRFGSKPGPRVLLKAWVDYSCQQLLVDSYTLSASQLSKSVRDLASRHFPILFFNVYVILN